MGNKISCPSACNVNGFNATEQYCDIVTGGADHATTYCYCCPISAGGCAHAIRDQCWLEPIPSKVGWIVLSALGGLVLVFAVWCVGEHYREKISAWWNARYLNTDRQRLLPNAPAAAISIEISAAAPYSLAELSTQVTLDFAREVVVSHTGEADDPGYELSAPTTRKERRARYEELLSRQLLEAAEVIQETKQNALCKICMNEKNPLSIVLSCGHVVCQECSDHLDALCPFDRKEILEKKKLYFV
jgi:hypothetical protein